MQTAKNKNIIFTLLEGGFAFLLLALVAFLIRVMVAPISLNYFRPELTGTLQGLANVDSVALEDITLDIGSRSIFPGVSVTGLSLHSFGDSLTIKFPQSYISLNIISLWQGDIVPSSVAIFDPKIILSKNALYTYLETYEEDTTITTSVTQSISDISAGIFSFFDVFPQFNSFLLENLSIRIQLEKEEPAFTLSRLFVKVKEKPEMESLERIISIFNPDTAWIEAEIEFAEFPFHILASFVPALEPMTGSSIFLNGSVGLRLDKSANLIEFTSQVDAKNAQIYYASRLTKMPQMKEIFLSWKIGKQFESIFLNDLTLITDEEQIRIKGQLTDFAGIPSFEVNLELSDLSLARLENIWPQRVEANTRKWITTHLNKGHINSANGQLSVKNENGLQVVDYFIDFDFDNVMIDHSPPMIPPEKLKGTGYFFDNGIHVQNVSGAISNSIISMADVNITGIATDSTKIAVTSNISGSAEDLLDIIYSAGVDSFIDLKGGLAESKLNLSFPLGPVPPFEQMDLTASSIIKDTEIRDIAGFNLANTEVELSYINGEILISGKVEIGGLPADVHMQYDLFAKNPIEISGTAILGNKDFSIFSIPDIPFLKGSGLATAKIIIDSSHTKISADIDLLNYSVDNYRVGINKSKGSPGSFQLAVLLGRNTGIEIPHWIFSAADYFARGTAYIGMKDERIDYRIKADSIRFGRNNLSLSYHKYRPNHYEIHSTGSSFDFSPLLTTEREDLKDTTAVEVERKGEFELTAQFDTVFVEKDIMYNNITANVSVGKTVIPEFGLKGVYGGDKKFQIALNTTQFKNKFYFHSEDAGIIFEGVGIDTSIIGGLLEVSADIIKSNKDSIYAIGKIQFDSIRVINVNTVAKLFALASLDGISNSAKNEGIIFNRMESDFKIQNRIIYISNGLIKSSAIGITFDGVYNIPREMAYIKGTLIPVNFANSILRNVPILRTLVDGGGIFAFNYSLKGKAGDFDISVNPFSIVTPGITRKVFDIFEKKPDSLEK